MNWLAHPQAPEGLLQAALWGVQHFRSALGLLLLLASLRCLYALARFVYVYLLRRGVDPLSYGAWAVVTGATDGIGKAYAALLAQRGEGARAAYKCREGPCGADTLACPSPLQGSTSCSSRAPTPG